MRTFSRKEVEDFLSEDLEGVVPVFPSNLVGDTKDKYKKYLFVWSLISLINTRKLYFERSDSKNYAFNFFFFKLRF